MSAPARAPARGRAAAGDGGGGARAGLFGRRPLRRGAAGGELAADGAAGGRPRGRNQHGADAADGSGGRQFSGQVGRALAAPGGGGGAVVKVCYFDCFSGISGDMVLGALVDAGADLGRIEAALRKLPVSGWTMAAEKVKRGPLRATQVRVTTAETNPHRALPGTLKLPETPGP